MATGQGQRWQDQWAQIERWRERVRQSRDDGRADGLGTDGYRDEVFALFYAVWHLKDWLKNDPTLGTAIRQDVEGWVNANGSSLTVIADVANGSKHLALSNPRAAGSRQTRNDVTIAMGIGVLHTFYVN